MTQRFSWPCAGKALEENIVQGENYRFTVLTDRLVRLEFDPQGHFEDRPTQRIFYRDAPPVNFSFSVYEGHLRLETAALRLFYQEGQPFGPESLEITLKTAPYTHWRYGEPLSNLKGTCRTLDQEDGPIPLEDGILSRQGLALVDDSDGVVLEDSWFALRNPETDVYLFAYGLDYKGALKALYHLTGMPPLLPDYALGNWWSRYHPYTQEEYEALVERFEEENLPFSVAVIDMDWHLVDKVPQEAAWKGMQGKLGWTGYTWDEELFPDYRAFLAFLHEHGLKTTLNLHPAQGVRSFEAMYREMCAAVGQDPEAGEPVKLDLLDPAFMEKYFDILHHPYEEAGVDFWWMDWQQGTNYWWIHDEKHAPQPLEKIDPLWLLNHLHILDISRNGKRPMFFSRYAGVGSSRYPIGFSGDTVVNWETLNFQPYFTNTASNVGYCWWSHDIGGHMFGYRDDELATRWVQYGVFSPINRLHSTRNEFTSKEPWKFNREACEIQEEFLRLRHRLFPYLYTMNHLCHAEGEPLIQPLYYAYPDREEAYALQNNYFFGTELLVAPITEKSDPVSRMGRTEVWLPEGDWFDAFLGLHYQGGKRLELYRFLEEYPVFAKAGAIVPTQDDAEDNLLGRRENLTLFVFPGADGSFTMTEDAGDGDGWKDGTIVRTPMKLSWSPEEAEFTVLPAEGDLSLLPETRNITVAFRGVSGEFDLYCADKVESWYDEEKATAFINVYDVPTDRGMSVKLIGGSLMTDNAHAETRALDIVTRAQASHQWKEELWNLLHKPCDLQTAEGRLLYREIVRSFRKQSQETRQAAMAIREMEVLTGLVPEIYAH